MIYIAVEGISGSGKTTIASYLGLLLPKNTPKFLVKECSCDAFCNYITKNMIDHWDKLDEQTKVLLIMALKNHTNSKTRHFFQEGHLIIGDRSPISTMVLHYDFFTNKENSLLIDAYHKKLNPIFPDIVIFLDTDEAIGGKRDCKNNDLHDPKILYKNYNKYFENSAYKNDKHHHLIRVKPRLTVKETVDSFIEELNKIILWNDTDFISFKH